MIWRIFFQWERISRFSTLCASITNNVFSLVKISRQINYLFSNHNSKSLESRNFFHKKRVRVNFRTFYTVFVHTKCGKTRNSLSLKQNFAIYFREIDWIKSTIMVFDKINSFTNTMQAVWKRTIKSDHAKKFREINSLVKTVKTLIWRKKY